MTSSWKEYVNSPVHHVRSSDDCKDGGAQNGTHQSDQHVYEVCADAEGNVCQDDNGNITDDEMEEFLMMVRCRNPMMVESEESVVHGFGSTNNILYNSNHHHQTETIPPKPVSDGTVCKKLCSKFCGNGVSSPESVTDDYEISTWTVSSVKTDGGGDSEQEKPPVGTDGKGVDTAVVISGQPTCLVNTDCDTRAAVVETVACSSEESCTSPHLGESDAQKLASPPTNDHIRQSKKPSNLNTTSVAGVASKNKCTEKGSRSNKTRTKSKSVSDDVVETERNKEHKLLSILVSHTDGASDDCNGVSLSNSTSTDLAVLACESDTKNKRMATKMTSVCLDDGLSRSAHHRVRRHEYDFDEPIHMTLEEVKLSLQQLYGRNHPTSPACPSDDHGAASSTKCPTKSMSKKGGPFHMNLRPKKSKDGEMDSKERLQNRKSFPSSIKQTFCSLFGGKKAAASSSTSEADTTIVDVVELRKPNRGQSKSSEELSSHNDVSSNLLNTPSRSIPSLSPFVNRALPPLPLNSPAAAPAAVEGTPLEENPTMTDDEDQSINFGRWENLQNEPMDFTASIHKVKDYGWYWGPISGEMAEKILANEPDGSFIVRDSSDEHYIFSLTFKLNGLVRHVRIEHDQGNFSFGTFTNFKSQTIVGFIENAVEHSRSGRYLFFLHRRPVLGPMRVQLLHPVSRFKQVQSLQHMCRFVILKAVRRDLIYSLPLPKRLKDYLNTPQYYTEDVDIPLSQEESVATQPAVTPEQNLLHGDLPEAVSR